MCASAPTTYPVQCVLRCGFAPLGHLRFDLDLAGGNGTMFSLLSPNRTQVDAVYAAARARGAVCEGAPGPQPHYGPHFYATYLPAADGNKCTTICCTEQA